MHNGQLYVFNADHAAGAWTGSDATKAKLADDVSDLKSQINNSITPYVTDGMTAPAALSVGDYVMANDTLYRVISPIANGATITPNTNVVATTEADELKRKANTDGNYPDMTVGNAEQLVATVGVEDKVPYLFRTSGGSADIGDREVDELVGGTVAWNQELYNGNFADGTSGWINLGGSTTISASNNEMVATLDSNFGGFQSSIGNTLIGVGVKWPSVLSGHKYFITADIKASVERTNRVGFGLSDYSSGHAIRKSVTVGTSYATYSFIGTQTDGDVATTSGRFMLYDERGSDGVTLYVKNVMAIDLTQMFGSAIADYIYALETATPGAGVAWFRKLFPKPYYAYNAGELMSVKTSAHKTVGFNQAESFTNGSSATAYLNALMIEADLLPNTTYCVSFKGVAGNKIYRNNELFSTAYSVITVSGERQFVLLTTVNDVSKNNTLQYEAGKGWRIFKNLDSNTVIPNFSDVCMNLSWDGERDGEYEPYEAHTYALDDIELRGIPKLDADNKLYYDGDTYESDGIVTRKYKTVVFEGATSESWILGAVGASSFKRFLAPLTDAKVDGEVFTYDIYTQGGQELNKCRIVSASGTKFDIYPAAADFADLDAWKTHLASHPLAVIYELATPTTESADPYQNPQIVNDFGTEEYVDTRTVPIPVGHDTQYQVNLRAKLEMAPNSPDSNGDYIVRHSNGQNTYVALTFPADELPAAPTTDGTYVLKVTIADGEATYSWVSE